MQGSLRDRLSPRLAYITVAIVSTAIIVGALFIIDSRSLWVLLPAVLALAFFPRKELARLLSGRDVST